MTSKLQPIEEYEIPDLDLNIQNVVATGSLNQTFSLIDINKIFKTTQYNPKRFPGLVFRLKRPKTSILIFHSGKMVCTGAKTVKRAQQAIRKLVRELKNNGIIILSKPKITIQNIVASGNLGKKVDLETAADLLENVMYEPEQFPGLIYRMSSPKVVILVFASGKIVCTGAKNDEMVHESTNRLYSVLNEFELFFT